MQDWYHVTEELHEKHDESDDEHMAGGEELSEEEQNSEDGHQIIELKRQVNQLKRELAHKQASIVDFSAKALPQNNLSRFVEHRVKNFLSEQQCQTDVIIRVVSNVNKEQKAMNQTRKFFGSKFGPFPYKSKCLFAIQISANAQTGQTEEVAFFAMYLQEFGSDCPLPNNRCVHLSYLDSIKYFQPGELRSDLYRTIILGYMAWAKCCGYSSIHFWSSPPSDHEVRYIFNGRPEDQKIPDAKRLHDWYEALLQRGIGEGTVAKYGTIHDYFGALESATSLPYFPGNYWPQYIESALSSIEQSKKKGKKPTGSTMNILADRLRKQLWQKRQSHFVVKLWDPRKMNVREVQDPDQTCGYEWIDERLNFLKFSEKQGWRFNTREWARWGTKNMAFMLHNSQ